MLQIDYTPTPTVQQFMLDPSYVRVLAGPIGSGKSVACVHELLRWASEQEPNSRGERKTRFLICRNTADQLRSTTLKTIFDWLPQNLAGSWVATERTFYIKFKLPDDTVVLSEWMAIALDTPDDVRKALSLEATGLWGNEARELHPDVVDGLLMRVNRYPSMKDGGPTRPGAIFDTNMPQVGTWWYEKFVEPPANWRLFVQPPAFLTVEEFRAVYYKDMDEIRLAADKVFRYRVDGESGVPLAQLQFGRMVIDATCKVGDTVYVVNPDAENLVNLNVSYYPQTIQGKSRDFIDVYLRCRFGQAKEGFPVFEAFRRDLHVASQTLTPIGAGDALYLDAVPPLVVGMDFGLTPAAVLTQADARGRVRVFAELTSFNLSVSRFIDELLLPTLRSGRFCRLPVVIVGDPAGTARSQVDERSVFDMLRAKRLRAVPASTNSLVARLAAVDDFLLRRIDDVPMLLIDPSCTMLINGLAGGYRYRRKRSGDKDDKPEKNEYSHVVDALQYAMLYHREHVGIAAFRPQFEQRRNVVQADMSAWV